MNNKENSSMLEEIRLSRMLSQEIFLAHQEDKSFPLNVYNAWLALFKHYQKQMENGEM